MNMQSAYSVGDLQELCMKKCLSMPHYSDFKREGDSHCPQFTIDCKVNGISSTGKGSSKKEAKKNCALEMLNKLKDVDLDNLSKANISLVQVANRDEDSSLKEELELLSELLHKLHIAPTTEKQKEKWDQLIEKLTDKKCKEKIEKLLAKGKENSKIEDDLMNFCAKSNFRIIIDLEEITEKSADGQHQVRCTIGKPVQAFSIGQGLDKKSAKRDAAWKALLFLKYAPKEL